MGKIKGAKEYKKFKDGKQLTRKQAMLTQCYVCNDLEESRADCLGYSCPMYFYAPYRTAKGLEMQKKCHLGS